MPASTANKQSTKGETICINPLTRIEGHMKIEAVVDAGQIKDARCIGTMFRGFENILIGRHPLDAARLTQRVCGVCPTSHGTAAAFCLDQALGVADRIPENGRLVRNLLLGANFLQSHILHFFTLAALDFVDVTAAADYDGSESDLKAVRSFIERGALWPFFPRYEGDYRCDRETNVALVLGYIKALRLRRVCHEMLAIFGGKMPHNIGLVPGGVTSDVTADKIAGFMSRLQDVREFVDDTYIPAVLTVAGAYGDYFDVGRGCGRFLSYGTFPTDNAATAPADRQCLLLSGLAADGKLQRIDAARISEEVSRSRYADDCSGPPSEGKTEPAPDKTEGYSWIKAPRYDGQPAEVGPLSRALVGYLAGDETIEADVGAAMAVAKIGPEKLPSVLGRHLARALEARWVSAAMMDWLGQLKPGEPSVTELTIPDEGRGVGLTGGPRGALGHWIEIRGGKIARYQLVVPTTWNGSPRDGQGVCGPIEQALIGTAVKDRDNPFELVRIVRSFDPCLACSVHVGSTLSAWATS